MEIEPFSLLAGVFVGFAIVSLFTVTLAIFRPWLRVVVSGGRVSIASFVGMRMRGNPSRLLIDAYLSLIQSGANVTLGDVESHYVVNNNNIFSASDLARSMRKEPIESHIPVWLDLKDANWLANFATNPASAVAQDSGQTCKRIATAAENSIAKNNRGEV